MNDVGVLKMDFGRESEVGVMESDNSSAGYKDTRCLPPDLLAIMAKILGEDSDTMSDLNQNCSSPGDNITASPTTWEFPTHHRHDLRFLHQAEQFHAYLTPFIIIIGLVGNMLSMKIFSCRRMRKVSASFYLTALAVADSLVLLTYVLLDWMPKGMRLWPGERSYDVRVLPGMCQTCLYLAYVFRFMSAWLIVIFTVERFIGVCKPLHRRVWCTQAFAKRAIVGITLAGMILSSYKPALSRTVQQGNVTICTRNTDYDKINVTLDGIYACSITAIPFGIIMVLNCLIIHQLNKTKRRHRQTKFSVDEGSIKFEFTAILLIISTTFVFLNLPYFVMWCLNFHRQLTGSSISIARPTEAERMRGWMVIAKTIFYGNYCVNFFLYSMSGAYFRRQLLVLVCSDVSCRSSYSFGISHASTRQMGPQTLRFGLPSTFQMDILKEPGSKTSQDRSSSLANSYG